MFLLPAWKQIIGVQCLNSTLMKEIVENCLSSSSCCGFLCCFIFFSPLKAFLPRIIRDVAFVWPSWDQMGRFQKVINLLSALLFYEA